MEKIVYKNPTKRFSNHLIAAMLDQPTLVALDLLTFLALVCLAVQRKRYLNQI